MLYNNITYSPTMEPEQDPFSFFNAPQDQQINELSKPKKKVHLDPMIHL